MTFVVHIVIGVSWVAKNISREIKIGEARARSLFEKSSAKAFKQLSANFVKKVLVKLFQKLVGQGQRPCRSSQRAKSPFGVSLLLAFLFAPTACKEKSGKRLSQDGEFGSPIPQSRIRSTAPFTQGSLGIVRSHIVKFKPFKRVAEGVDPYGVGVELWESAKPYSKIKPLNLKNIIQNSKRRHYDLLRINQRK